MSNFDIQQYYEEGCGRCELSLTPQCKAKQWIPHFKLLRKILIDSGLAEERKWGSPCYTWNGANVAMLGGFKDYGCLSFFKGVLIDDSENILVFAGENSQSAKLFKFTTEQEIIENQDLLQTYIMEAIKNEVDGKKVVFPQKDNLELVEELLEAFEQDVELKEAFYALTPGRQRGYHIHFSGAKQSATRKSRIEKYREKIISGLGFFD